MRFFVSGVKCAAWASKFARFPPKTGSRRSPCSEFRFLPRKACEFQPAELVAACHRFVTARFLGAKVRKTGPSSRAPSPQGFSRPDSPPRTRLSVRQPAEVVRQPAAFGPEKRRIPARRASPLVTAFSPLSLGPKSAQKRPSSREDTVLLRQVSFAGLIMRPRCPKRFDRRHRTKTEAAEDRTSFHAPCPTPSDTASFHTSRTGRGCCEMIYNYTTLRHEGPE